ncbi:uncharacterized protein PFB0145c isoform X2 [Aplysia californica]|uniref:Uncharacterized protein PFB0145c isoform X2 n=1 Tax=Aplysia californica TaxID=6500 RepID=A0ABM0JCW6_APLCA|nr:uncharacterized protein PFB0145c isoform X2 [Aplysia californica]
MAERSKWSNLSQVIGRACSPVSSPTIQRANRGGRQGQNSPSPGSTSCPDTFIINSGSSSNNDNSNNNNNNIYNSNADSISSNSSLSSLTASITSREGGEQTMASNMSFADWRQASNESLMTTAENLLDNLEDVADILTEIDDKYITSAENEEVDDARASIIQRFHEGVESARNVVGVLKREKWRLSKREMSVELKMGELEDYKSHLRSDMSSLNQTVDALSMRVVQLENQLVEAQEVQENLEAEVAEHKRCMEDATQKYSELLKEKNAVSKELGTLKSHTMDTLSSENSMLKNEIMVLRDENHKLKELIRGAETHPQQNDDDHLARLTRDFLKELSSLEVEKTIHGDDSVAELQDQDSSKLNGTL